MRGRFTHLYTWDDIYRYHSFIGETPTDWGQNFNVCPTQDVGAVFLDDGKRRFQRMRWSPVPRWWSKSLKESTQLATFNARAKIAQWTAFVEALAVQPGTLEKIIQDLVAFLIPTLRDGVQFSSKYGRECRHRVAAGGFPSLMRR